MNVEHRQSWEMLQVGFQTTAVKQATQIIWFPCARQRYVHSLL